MTPFRLLAPALLAFAAPLAASSDLVVMTQVTDKSTLHVHVTDALGTFFGVQASLDPSFQSGVQLVGMGRLLSGEGERVFRIASPGIFSPNTTVYLRAGYMNGGQVEFTPVTALLLNAVPAERIDFSYAPPCELVVNGEVLRDQWADVGVHILVDTSHPTNEPAAIALDSGAPDAEADLATPGSGVGNTVPRGNLLVIEGDGGGAEDAGGLVVFDFDRPTYLDRITLIDVDTPDSYMRCYDGPNMVAEMDIPVVGDNSAQTLGFPLIPVTRLSIGLKSAAGIAELSFLPCAERVDFDHTMTGIPLGLVEGEVVRDQMRGLYGMRVLADTHHPTNDGVAVALRSKNDEDTCDRLNLGVAADPTDTDGDGVLDGASAEPLGGVIVLDFDFDVTWRSASVRDVDDGEVSFFVAEDANGSFLGVFPLTVGSNNSVQTVAPDLSGVRRIRLNLGGDGALVALEYCADDQP
jgi:hypothetical protein